MWTPTPFKLSCCKLLFSFLFFSFFLSQLWHFYLFFSTFFNSYFFSTTQISFKHVFCIINKIVIGMAWWVYPAMSSGMRPSALSPMHPRRTVRSSMTPFWMKLATWTETTCSLTIALEMGILYIYIYILNQLTNQLFQLHQNKLLVIFLAWLTLCPTPDSPLPTH